MAVGTQSLEISGIVVTVVPVYVVNVELAAVLRDKPAMLAGVLLVQGVWILVLLYVSFINSLTTEATSGS